MPITDGQLQDQKIPPSPEPLRRKRKLEIDRNKITQRILADFEAAKTDRQPWETAQTKWIEMYEGILGERVFPYGPEASSNFHVPITASNILRLHAVLGNVFQSSDTIVHVDAQSEEDEKVAQEKVQPHINWDVKTHMRAVPIIDKEILYLIIRGTWIGFVDWVQEYRGGVDIHSFPLPPDGKDVDEAYIFNIFEKISGDGNVKITSMKRKADNPLSLKVKYTERIDNKSVPREANVEVYVEDDRVEIDVERQIKDYEGNRLLSIPLEDWYLSKDCARVGVQRCTFVMRKYRLTLEDVRQNKIKGRWEFDDEGWTKILSHVDKLVEESHDIKNLKESVEGTERLHSLQEIQELDALSCFYLYDVNKDDLKEQVIFTVILGAGVLVEAVRLEERYRSGYRPIFKTVFIPREDSAYGKSLPELLEDVQDLYNEIFDLFVDWTKMTAAPFGVYRSTSSFKPEKTYYEPGSLLGVDDVQRDIAFPSWPQQNQVGMLNIIGMLNQFAERLTSQGALQFGQIPTGKSAALRTTGNFMGLLQQGDTLANAILKRIYDGLGEFFRILHMHNQEYMPDTEFRVTGKDGKPKYLKITRDELRIKADFSFSATTESQNPTVQRDVAMALNQMLFSPIAIQSGIVKEDNIYHGMKEMILSLGRKDVSSFITKPESLKAGPIMDGQQVIALLSQGEVPKVNPAADLQEHIETITNFLKLNPLSAFGLTPEYLPLFDQYLQEATQMVNALEQRKRLMEAAQQSQGILGQLLGGGGGGQAGAAPSNDGAESFAPGLAAEQETF